jgi:hypothetical protein
VDEGLGPTATRSLSPDRQTVLKVPTERSSRRRLSTCSATKRSASSRSAVRCVSLKKFSAPRRRAPPCRPCPPEALAKGLGRDIDELDLVGQPEDRVGDGLVDGSAGDLAHGVGPALDMLDVEGRVDVDPGVQQLDHVLVALRMARARGVRVRELVDEDQLGLAREDRLQVHLGDLDVLVFDLLRGNDREPREEGLGLGAAMGLDDPDNEVDAVPNLLLGGAEHGERLADARAHSEEHLQLAPARAFLLAVERRQKGIGIGALLGHRLI